MYTLRRIAQGPSGERFEAPRTVAYTNPVPSAPRAKRKASAAAGKTAAPRAGPLGTFFARNAIVAGAATVFGRKGAAETTVEDILEASGISRRTFYRFFDNKEDVLDALHEVACELFLRNLREASAESSGTAIERLARSVDVYLEFGQRQGALMLVLQGEALREGSRLAVRRRAVFDQLVEMMDGSVYAAQRRHVEPLVLRGLLAALEGMSRTLLESGAPDAAAVARAKRSMMRILGATLATSDDVVPPLPLAHAHTER
jgi:AcrR family transcriptional regulator